MYLSARTTLLSQLNAVWDSAGTIFYQMAPEIPPGFCAHPHPCKQNSRKVISTFTLEVTIKAVFELHLFSEPQLAFPESFLIWRGWYKGKLLGHQINDSLLNLLLCCLSSDPLSDAFAFVPTCAVSASSLTFYRIFASFPPPLPFIFTFLPLHIHLTEKLSNFKSSYNKLQLKWGTCDQVIPRIGRSPNSA